MPHGIRVGDATAHGGMGVPGIGSIDVMYDGRPAWRALEDQCVCAAPPGNHGTEVALLGSTTVLINGRMAVRVGDVLQGASAPNSFVPMPDQTVIIGDLGFGMGTAANKETFAIAMRSLLDKWDKLSPKARLKAIQKAVNASKPSAMPALKVHVEPSMTDAVGELNFEQWQVDINPNQLSGTMDESKMAELVDTVYHEARHGEQFFNVAQSRAAQGQSARQIKRETTVPPRVARAATNSPAARGTSEGEMGAAVDDSVYGSQSPYREQVLTDVENDTPGAYDQYRALPEEQDAWNQAGSAKTAFLVTAY